MDSNKLSHLDVRLLSLPRPSLVFQTGFYLAMFDSAMASDKMLGWVRELAALSLLRRELLSLKLCSPTATGSLGDALDVNSM